MLKGLGKEWLAIIYYKIVSLRFTNSVLIVLSPLGRLKQQMAVLSVLSVTNQEAGVRRFAIAFLILSQLQIALDPLDDCPLF